MRTRCDVLLITGMKSKYVGDTEAIHREMRPGLCSIIKAGQIFLQTWHFNSTERLRKFQSL